jgi:hypothetical protein
MQFPPIFERLSSRLFRPARRVCATLPVDGCITGGQQPNSYQALRRLRFAGLAA